MIVAISEGGVRKVVSNSYDTGNVLGHEQTEEWYIIGKVADYICDHNRGKPTIDERNKFKNDLAHDFKYGNGDLLMETYDTLMDWCNEDDTAKLLCEKFAKLVGIDAKNKQRKTQR